MIASLCVFALYGKPFLNRDITGGQSYSAAAREAGVSNIWIQMRKIVSRLSDAALLGGVLLSLYVEHLFRRLVKRTQINKFRLFLKICIFIKVLAVCGWCFLSLMDFFKMRSLPMSPFSEYLRVSFIWSSVLTFVSAGFLIDELVFLLLTAGDNIYRIARDNSLGNYTALIRKNELEAAEEALLAAAEMDTEGVVSLVVRAAFCDIFLSAHDEAKKHLETAAENLKKAGKIKNEDMATYEFCIGNILLNKNEYAKAIEHFKRSLELDYNAEREGLLKKVQLLEHNERPTVI